MARAWAHRMQYFYDLVVEANDLRIAYTEDMVASYQEPPEITALDSDCVPRPKVRERLRVVRSFL